MLAIPQIHAQAWLFLPAIGVGLGWASIMGNPYVMLARSVPPERTGVYMGIFNMFIVIPMLIVSATLPFMYRSWLQGDPRHVLMLSGVLMLCATVMRSPPRLRPPRRGTEALLNPGDLKHPLP
jgi:maltose/moltooligosaccharide transporter